MRGEELVMKIIIEVNGGVVCGIVSTRECDIYLVDHDNIRAGHPIDVNEVLEAMQPDCVTHEWTKRETPLFDQYLAEALSGYSYDLQVRTPNV